MIRSNKFSSKFLFSDENMEIWGDHGENSLFLVVKFHYSGIKSWNPNYSGHKIQEIVIFCWSLQSLTMWVGSLGGCFGGGSGNI